VSLFGNKEIQELRSELERAGARVKKAEADLASAMKKAAAAEQAGNDATESAAALERQVQELRRLFQIKHSIWHAVPFVLSF